MKTLLLVMALGPGVSRAPAQEPPEPADLINAVLEGLLGFRDSTGPELQEEVAAAGEVPFRAPVPVDYLSPRDLPAYLKDVLDDEYPEARALADARTLTAFDLLPPGTDLRALRLRLLEENVAGFYDDRPGRKRLYAVSDERRLTPANQLVLSHELRHALQDQYLDVHHALPASIGDFDDRRIAFMSLLEGDATFVMERFLLRRLGAEDREDPGQERFEVPLDPSVPAVLRAQLSVPYLAGRDFARALWKKGGGRALKDAWAAPPPSTEQVLHPEKYFAGEGPRPVVIGHSPAGAKLVADGVLGEALVRTLLGDGAPLEAAAGWGGDRFQVWDVGERTLLVWRSVWDSGEDAREFRQALLGRLEKSHGPGRPLARMTVFRRGSWSVAVGEKGGGVVMLSTDDPAALLVAVKALG